MELEAADRPVSHGKDIPNAELLVKVLVDAQFSTVVRTV